MDDSSQMRALQADVAALQRKLDYVVRHLGLQYSDDPLEPGLAQAAEFLRQGNEIEAIKAYRNATGAGLKQSKDAVEALKQTLPGA